MFLAQALHNGSPEFMLAVLALLATLVMSQTVSSSIAQHPYVEPEDGGDDALPRTGGETSSAGACASRSCGGPCAAGLGRAGGRCAAGPGSPCCALVTLKSLLTATWYSPLDVITCTT